MYEVVFDAGCIVEFQSHRTPDTAGGETDTPVPSVAIRSLTAVDTYASLAVVVVGRILESVGFPLWQAHLDRRMEIYLQAVFAFAEHILYREFIAHEHVVCTFQQRAVQVDVGISVQTFEVQQGCLAGQLLLGECKGGLVLPIFLFYPLHLLFVHAEERVDELVVVNQILVYGARYGSRQPLTLTYLGELPALVQADFLRFLVFCCVQQHRECCEHHPCV